MIANIASLLGELRVFASLARTRLVRSMLEFAEQEIIIPNGPFEGRFRHHRLPYAGLLLKQIDSGRWNTIVCTGPTQSGKTMMTTVIPALYHLFEMGENVVFALPDMNMARDKWQEDLRPVIARTRYADLIPRLGGGSRGGEKMSAVAFRNGATLRFMTGGGGDAQRAGYTARVLVITETDSMDESGASSDEASKIKQLFGRTRAYSELTGKPPRVYAECTVTVAEGYVWHTIKSNTDSRIALPCAHCGEYVTPGREHLVGWQDAVTVYDAKQNAAYACPLCGVVWTEPQRRTSNESAVLLHKGQTIKRGRGKKRVVISGDQPRTDVLGFRWSAVNNLLRSAADIAAEEWHAMRASDEEDADRALCQQVWAVPPAPKEIDDMPLTRDGILARALGTPKGFVPDGTDYLTMGIDLHKRLGYWVLVASRSCGTCHIADYGAFEIPSDSLGSIAIATLASLREFRDVIMTGWASISGQRVPDQVWIDSGYSESQDALYRFCRESAKQLERVLFRPSKGYGISQERGRNYTKPRSTGNYVRQIGQGYHLVWMKDARLRLVEINVDYWKTYVHERLSAALGTIGAMTLYKAMVNEHRTFVHHLTAEKQVEEFIAGKGTVKRWQRIRRGNHWLDAVCQAVVAAYHCGVRLIPDETPRPVVEASPIAEPAYEDALSRRTSGWKIGR